MSGPYLAFKLYGLEQEEGMRLWFVVSLKPDALWKIQETIEAVTGIKVEGAITWIPEQWIGKHCTAVVMHEYYRDKAMVVVKELKR